jgi:hypothetical protein
MTQPGMKSLRDMLFPDPPRTWPQIRLWNIAFRSAHIAVTGVLVGGHVFGIQETRLLPWLYLTLATGTGLLSIEVLPTARWCYQGRGVLVLVKLLLVGLVPWLWNYRVPLLLAVVLLASVGSHMPKRLRYCSLLHGDKLDDRQ